MLTRQPAALSVDCRRAVSTIYYALFHCLARTCADLLVGKPGNETSRHAWSQVYRALKHGTVAKRCAEKTILDFPTPIQDWAMFFRDLQFEREECGYRAEYAVAKSKAKGWVEQARTHIAAFNATPLKDRRAFAVYVLVDSSRHIEGRRPERTVPRKSPPQ